MQIRNIQTDTDNFIRPAIATVDSPPPAQPARANSVTCNACSRRFAPAIVTERVTRFIKSVLSEQIPTGGELWYFVCPHCAHRYNVCHISRQGIELRHQLNSIKSQLRLAPNRIDLAQQKEQLQAAYLQEVTSLIPLGYDNDGGLTNAILTNEATQ